MPDDHPPDTVEAIRSASRLLVRELGFMGENFAGGDLSPSAVHALIEIEAGAATARALGLRLHLEKSSVSRMLGKLVAAGDVAEQAASDGRLKILVLTAAGQRRVAAIHSFARSQVCGALARGCSRGSTAPCCRACGFMPALWGRRWHRPRLRSWQAIAAG